MLKSSGSSCLCSGANKAYTTHQLTFVTAAESMCLTGELLPHCGWVLVAHTEPNIPGVPVLVTFKYPMIRGSAIHTAYRIFAAFFIVMGT